MYDLAEVEMIEDTIPAIKSDIEMQFNLCKKIVYKTAHSTSKKFRSIESSEIFQKAQEIFTECYYKYNSNHGSKAKLSTYLYSVLYRKLYKWCRHIRDTENKYFNSLNDQEIIYNETDYSESFGYFKDTLSENSRSVVETILEYQTEIQNSNSKYKTKPNKNSIMRFLTEQKHANKKDILNSYAEITSALRG